MKDRTLKSVKQVIKRDVNISDKRYYGRHDCQLDGVFEWPEQLQLTLRVINFSHGGLGFEISHDQKLQLIKNDIDLSIGTTCQFIGLYDNKLLDEPITARIRHLRRVSENTYIGGLEFTKMTNRQLASLKLIINHLN